MYMYIKNEDTICAPATVPGTGAISVIRVSGPDALTIADKVVNCRRGRISEAESYTLKFGVIYDNVNKYESTDYVCVDENSNSCRTHNVEGSEKQVIDEVLVSVFRAPHSYTGEDSMEISCHASSYIVARIMDLLYAAGARAAERSSRGSCRCNCITKCSSTPNRVQTNERRLFFGTS